MASPQLLAGQQVFAQPGLQGQPQQQQLVVLQGAGAGQLSAGGQQQLGGQQLGVYGLNPYSPQAQQLQLVGAGAGIRVLAPQEIQQQYARLAGGPAFFDASRGVYFDGRQAYIYQAAPAGQLGAYGGVGGSPSLANVATAIPLQGAGASGLLILGNGTQGNLSEHRNAVASYYIVDNRI